MAGYDYIVNQGIVTEDTSSLLTDVQNEWKNALGQDLDTDGSTPQGTLIAAETLARTNVMKNNADLANTINPEQSYGVFLDAIAALLGIDRGQDSSTVGTGIQITGTPTTTTVLAGSRVQTSNGDIFFVVADTVIPASGTGTVSLQSQAYGPIPLPVGPLTIVDGIIGWGSCTVLSGSSVSPGANALNDPKFKTKRKQQLAYQGVGAAMAVKAAVLGIPGVIDCNVVENNTSQTATPVQGITFTLPNALWVCVAGSTPANQQQIAQAIFDAHQGGCPWDFGGSGMGTPVNSPNGVNAIDPSSQYAYATKWVAPVMYDVYVNITVKQGTSSASAETVVQNAIFAYASGNEDGEEGLLIGTSVSAFEMAGAVARNVPGMYIKSCTVAVVTAGSPAPAPGAYTSEVVMLPYQMAQLAIGNILVTLQ